MINFHGDPCPKLRSICALLALVTTSSIANANLPYKMSWSEQFGTSSLDASLGLSIDNSGGVYLTGYTSRSFEDNSIIGQTPYLAKYDVDGHRQWIVQDTSFDDSVAVGVSADGLGNVYQSGDFNSIVDDCCDSDAFLSKYDAAGNLLWRSTLRNDFDERFVTVSSDQIGNIFIAGQTWGGIVTPNPIRLPDVFVAKYNTLGDLIWLREFGSDDYEDEAAAVSADGLGNAYVVGLLDAEDGFVSKFDSDGVQLWTARLDNAHSAGVFADGLGNVFVSGIALETLDSPDGLNSGVGTFLAKYNDAGGLLWVRQFGTIYGGTAAPSRPIWQETYT